MSNDVKETSTIISTNSFYKKSDYERKKENALAQRERREGVHKQLENINKRLDNIEEIIADKYSQRINIEFQGEKTEWTISDIKCFIDEIGKITEIKLQHYISELSFKDQQKFYKLNKYSQALELLKH
jgi:hypothetical protein